MSIKFYMDEHVSGAITRGLRQRGVDVLTVQEDGRLSVDDPLLLDRATELNRVMFSRDSDFLADAAKRQAEGLYFSGVVYAHQDCATVGKCIEDLEIIAGACTPDELENQVKYIPL